MNESLKKLWHGFLFGIGFGVALSAITYVSTLHLVEAVNSKVTELNEENRITRHKVDIQTTPTPIDLSDVPTLYPVTEDHELAIESHRAVISGLGIEMLGTLTNNSDNEYRSVELEAELFDSHNKFIYECKEYLHEPMPPASSLNFKVSCHPLGKDVKEAYETYKLRVVHVSMLPGR